MIEEFIFGMQVEGYTCFQCPDCDAAFWFEGTEKDPMLMRLGGIDQDECQRCKLMIKEATK
tara:strand:+ start:3221 stop:3403 length:183 start_codon:yes stop_codon:yes gene_type:complete